MNEKPRIDAEELLEEIGGYLEAVDLFRALDSEPTWRPEVARVGTPDDPVPAQAAHSRSAH